MTLFHRYCFGKIDALVFRVGATTSKKNYNYL
jgi:hypothetical protein